MVAKSVFILTLSLALAAVAFSQSPLRLAFNKKISTDNGLSSYNVKKNFQDKYGFIWIVTQDGLNRYDGKEFLIYNKSMDGEHELLGSDVWDVEEDSKNDMLWVVTAYGGLNGISLKTGKVTLSLRAQITTSGFNHDWLRCLKLCENKLWIGTYDGLTIYNAGTRSFEKFEPLPFKKRTGSRFCIDKIFVDKHGNVWIFVANYGVVVYSGKSKMVLNYYPLEKIAIQNELTNKQFNSLALLPDGTLLSGTTQGFRRFSYNEKGITGVLMGLFNTHPAFDHTDIQASATDSLGYVWFSASSKLFKADMQDETIREVKDVRINLQNDWLTNIYDIFFDAINNIWLGTGKGVTYTKNTVPVFTPYYMSEDQTAKIDHAQYIYSFDDTVIYVCTQTGLMKVNTNENKMVSLLGGKSYYFITEHPDKNLLVSSEDSFFVYRPRNNRFSPITQFYPELKPLGNASVNSILYASDTLAIIGTQTADGFYLWNYKKGSLRKYQPPKALQTTEAAIVNATYKDTKNRIWILGNKLITLYDEKNQRSESIILKNPVSNIPYNLFFDVCEARGYFWIAAYGSGLIQVDNNFNIIKIYSNREGLSNAGVYKVFPVNDSLIFISTNYGLSVLNLNTRLFSNYFREDGLNSNAFEQGCGVYDNGKIYMGGINGFTSIDPRYFATNNMPPTLYLNRIRIETESGFQDTSNTFLNALDIPNNALQTTISFSALNYSNPSRTTYAYKIGELNSNWIHLGTQNFVSLIGLPPGTHTLLIKSANENNVWNNKPLQLTLHYLPKWYQTILFKILVVLVIAGMLYSIYAYRISQLKKQQKIRKEISADLHDDFGGILEGVKISAHLAKKEMHKQEHLNRIEDSLKQASVAFRDVIWILNDKEDTIYQFMERIKSFALPMTNASNIQLNCRIEPGMNEKILSKAEKRHLLLIVKESITNSVRYSNCRKIDVSVRLINNKIGVFVEDDGKGFDVDTASTGNGLKNMVYRAGEIRYRVEVTSRMGEGTKVRVVKI